MYQDNETLITTFPIGKEDTDSYIPKGTTVKYIKVIPNDNDLAMSMIAIEYGDKTLMTLETNVKVKSWWRRRKAFKQFNKQMMINNPRLRRYHTNPILKLYYRTYYFIVDNFGEKK